MLVLRCSAGIGWVGTRASRGAALGRAAPPNGGCGGRCGESAHMGRCRAATACSAGRGRCSMSRPLNFLHLTTFYPPYSFGGDAMYLYRLCHMLGDLGHHCDVVHCVDSYHLLHPGEPEIRFADHPNVKVHGLRSGWGLLSPLLTQQTGRPFLKGRRIRAIADSRPYDVIHYHNISLLGPKVLALRPAQGRPVKMYTTHEHWLICPTHVLWKYNRRACEKPDCLRCTLHARKPPQVWRYTGLLRRMSKHVDQFVSPSRFTAGMHAQR